MVLKDKTKNYQAGYVVVSLIENTEAGPITVALSAQQAKLFVLTRACFLAEGQTINIYTNSHCSTWFWYVLETKSVWTSIGQQIENSS